MPLVLRNDDDEIKEFDEMAHALLTDRSIIEIGGPASADFLHNLVTNSMHDMENGEARFAALLTPQGKIIADGFFVKVGDAFLLDCPRALVSDLIKKLGLYRLRAPVTILDQSETYQVIVQWNETPFQIENAVAQFLDPRHAELGFRIITPIAHFSSPTLDHNAEGYHAHRIALGIPEGGKDFIYGDAFPHETDMDQLNGIDFKKGCYVGQEVVSRMQHRGLARTRAVPVLFHDGFAAEDGSTADAQGKSIGVIGSSTTGGKAIAILRLDRVEDALSAGAELTAGGLAFSLESRPWIGFSVPRSK